MATRTIELLKAQEHFPELLVLALNGDTLLVTEEGQPLIQISAAAKGVMTANATPVDFKVEPAPTAYNQNMEALLENFMEEILQELIMIDTELNLLKDHPKDYKQIEKIRAIFHKINYNCNIISAKKLKKLATATVSLIEKIQMHLHQIDHVPVEVLQSSADSFTTIIRNLLRDRTEGNADFSALTLALALESKKIEALV